MSKHKIRVIVGCVILGANAISSLGNAFKVSIFWGVVGIVLGYFILRDHSYDLDAISQSRMVIFGWGTIGLNLLLVLISLALAILKTIEFLLIN